MRVGSVGLFLITTVAAVGVASAQGRPAKAERSAVQLQRALSAVVASTQATMPPAKTLDNDQGDDHANPGAILRVCSKDTPAAHRAAICRTGVSPQ